LPGAVVWSEVGNRDTAGSTLSVPLDPDATTKVRLFVAASAKGEEHSRFHMLAQPTDGVPGSREARPAKDDVIFERPDTEDDG
jgi:hypothetical protein